MFHKMMSFLRRCRALEGAFTAIGSRLSLRLARLGLRLLSGEKALVRDWRRR